jgi:hypothetical protein
MKTRKRPVARKTRRRPPALAEGGHVAELLEDVASHPETGPVLTGGDPDADWVRAYSSGDEAVGGSVATPDQDVVDEIGRALGVEQEADAPVTMSEEILRRRDRFRWHLERDAADREEGRARWRATR